MKRLRLKSKEANKILKRYNVDLNKRDQVELIKTENLKIISINKVSSFFYYRDEIVPTLKKLQIETDLLKQIVVDMGAIKFVVNGADIMRPGIVKVGDEILERDFVVIIDETNKKPLAVGIALVCTEEMRAKTGGKVIKNIHFVGDEIWELE